jgi:hypothetical protein
VNILIRAKLKGRILTAIYNVLSKHLATVKVGGHITVDQITRKKSAPQGSALGSDFFNYSSDDICFWVKGKTIEEGRDKLQNSSSSKNLCP